ncbi:hypothetical protein EWM62_09690 [Mucilaginibacter terrigena]|uniref:Uncharacterized protein n=1 Tax=Mucilaginibacter terrigena TaxID=2492395 RepID=A0A4V1ZBZ7_9SPHI|nr:hypothetical protein [Mucilaginibacter terrigena]RYU90900.1 hypothetical protein EWM62_09690 [Mucilaginibacter terrigena]
MYNLLKLPIILGTLLTLILGYVTLDVFKLEKTFANSLMIWVVSIGIIFLLNIITIAKQKVKKHGEKFGAKLFESKSAKNDINSIEPAEVLEKPTFFQEASELTFIGEYVATLFAAVSLLAVALIFNSSDNNKAIEKWEVILIAILTFFWLKYLESSGRVKLCTPYLPIPLKWLVFPGGIWILFTY